MSLQIDYPITVDLKKPSSELTFAVQGDGKGRRLIVTVVSDNEEVDISDCTAHLKCSFEGKTVDISACEIEGNRIIAPLTSAMLANSGKHLLQLTLFDGSGAVISSPIIHICVSESISDGELSSTPEFSALNALTARIESVLNDPEVGDSEVKDARGGYALLGDRISVLEAAGINALSFKGAKNCVRHSAGFTAESVGADSFYTTGLTLSAEDGCAVAEGTAGAPCSVYALFDEPITLARDSSRQVLAVMRIKAVQSDLRVYPLAGRYSGYYNYLCDSNIIESNITEHIGTNSYVQPLKKGEWLTIWALLGDTGKSFKLGGDETQLNGLGVYIPTQTDGTAPKLMIQSVCAYVSDSEERDLINEVRDSVNAISGRLTISEGRINDNARVMENLQTSTDNTNQAVASLSEAVNNSSDTVAEVKSVVEDMQRNLSELSTGGFNDKKEFAALQTNVAENSERLTEVENDIINIQGHIERIGTNIDVLSENDKTHNERITELENENHSDAARLLSLESKAAISDTSIADLKAQLGLLGDDVLGLQVDYQAGTFTRLAGAANLHAGSDFNEFEMYGGRKRCNVSNDGTITAYYGDAAYMDDGSNGQVMVYQPKFYYLIAPLVLEKQDGSSGFHLRKANYYISSRQYEGFKLHPAFVDNDGHEIDYILYSAYEGSVFDSSEGDYLQNDEQVADFDKDILSSISGVKPASGKEQNLTRGNIEKLAQNRGANWHNACIKTEAANQLLMLIEYGTPNLQGALAKGIVDFIDSPNTENNSLLTGSTSSLGNISGQAEGTNGKASISYRGIENPWGNHTYFVSGINIYNNVLDNTSEPYIYSNISNADNSPDTDYEYAGFNITRGSGNITAFGYSRKYDWLFLPSESKTSSSIVGDAVVARAMTGYNAPALGGGWSSGDSGGAFFANMTYSYIAKSRNVGGRTVYIPSKATNE
ncbi:MAG: hypothetical protein ACI4F2_01200 [Acutalibacteraceae bacterium]